MIIRNRKRNKIEKKAQSTSEQKNIEVISNIYQNVRMRVRMLLLNSDPLLRIKQILFHIKKNDKFLFIKKMIK